jgi:hypothetical protein
MGRMMKGLPAFALSIAALASAWSSVSAAATVTSYQLLLQSRDDASAGSEVFLASYASLDSLRASQLTAPSQFTQINVGPSFEIRGLTWDGSAYRVLLQSRDDASAGSEVFLASYASLDALLVSQLTAPSQFSQINVGPSFQINGLTWDGSAYRVLLQSRDDASAGSEVFLASYASLDALLVSQLTAPSQFSQINVGPSFQISDFTWDGSAYRVLLQSRDDASAGSEVFLASYASLDALLVSQLTAPSEFTQINVGQAYRIAGFASVSSTTDSAEDVAEPATWAMMIFGLAAAAVMSRRR